jgi:hypothetical protein
MAAPTVCVPSSVNIGLGGSHTRRAGELLGGCENHPAQCSHLTGRKRPLSVSRQLTAKPDSSPPRNDMSTLRDSTVSRILGNIAELADELEWTKDPRRARELSRQMEEQADLLPAITPRSDRYRGEPNLNGPNGYAESAGHPQIEAAENGAPQQSASLPPQALYQSQATGQLRRTASAGQPGKRNNAKVSRRPGTVHGEQPS